MQKVRKYNNPHMYPSVSQMRVFKCIFQETFEILDQGGNRVDGIKVKYENISEADFDVFIG